MGRPTDKMTKLANSIASWVGKDKLPENINDFQQVWDFIGKYKDEAYRLRV
jgi:hypothetical protein